MARLPNSNRLILDLRKIGDYCLSATHPRGRHKARVFREALGLERADAQWLRNALLEAARDAEALELKADAMGLRWRVDLSITRQGRHAVIRSLWLMRAGEETPRFVTCWVL
jgi:hypothetical protein